MPTPAEVLVILSPLLAGTPAEHLNAITAGGGGTSATIVGFISSAPRLEGSLVASESMAGSVTPEASLTGEVAGQQNTAGHIVASDKLVGATEDS